MKKDIESFGLDELLLAAIKSEIESNRIYKKVARQVKNAFLKERLIFLAREELKHKIALKKLFQEIFKTAKITLPKKNFVPLPQIILKAETVPLSEIFKQAMKAEKETAQFYHLLAMKFVQKDEHKKLLNYLALMETGHFRIFEIEKDHLEEFEDYQQEIPLIHVGP